MKGPTYGDFELCFAYGWDKFNPDEHEYSFDLRFNYGDVPEPRAPQTFFEEAPYDQNFITVLSRTGYLQL